MSLPEFTAEEVASHSSSDSIWMVIDGKVYDVTTFQEDHPGGADKLLNNAGGDATAAFKDVGHSEDAVSMRDSKYLIGTLKAPSTQAPPTERPVAPIANRVCGCCGREDCRGWLYGGVGAVLVGVLAVGLGFFLYRRYHK